MQCSVLPMLTQEGMLSKDSLLQNTPVMTAFLIVFASICCPALVQFSKQTRTSVHTISFVASFQYFLHSHLSRTSQTFEASSKLVQTGDYPALLLANPKPKHEDGFLIKL